MLDTTFESLNLNKKSSAREYKSKSQLRSYNNPSVKINNGPGKTSQKQKLNQFRLKFNSRKLMTGVDGHSNQNSYRAKLP